LQHHNLHPLIAAICCGYTIKEEYIEASIKAGKGGFGDVFYVDKNFVVKKIVKITKGMIHPMD
jgi:hypothetical protein